MASEAVCGPKIFDSLLVCTHEEVSIGGFKPSGYRVKERRTLAGQNFRIPSNTGPRMYVQRAQNLFRSQVSADVRADIHSRVTVTLLSIVRT